MSFPVFWRSSFRAKDQSTTSIDIPGPNVGEAERELMDFSTGVKGGRSVCVCVCVCVGGGGGGKGREGR